MQILLMIFCFCFSLYTTLQAAGQDSKKILILSSNGGYGHGAAEKTLQVVLGKNYALKVIYPIEELRIWGASSGESVYNTMLREEWVHSMNAICKYVAPKLFRNRRRTIERLIDRHIQAERPDIVISLIPFINYPATEAARKREVPYLLITTDNDLRNWVHGLQSVTHPHFRITVGSDLPSTSGLLEKRHIPKEAIEVIGLPLRDSFKIKKNLNALQETYQIPKGKPTILIMMGGAGGEKCLDYTRTIGNLPIGVHLIVCTGKNTTLSSKLKEISLHASNSLTIMGFTNEMADLMALSQLMITKPGPGVINEAMETHLPVLVDRTSKSLSWERANISLVSKYRIGEAVTEMKELPQLLNKYLFDQEFRQNLQTAFEEIPSNQFNERVRSLVDSMCP